MSEANPDDQSSEQSRPESNNISGESILLPAPPTEPEPVILPTNHRGLSRCGPPIFRRFRSQKILFARSTSIVWLRYDVTKREHVISEITPEEFSNLIESLGPVYKHVCLKEGGKAVLKPSICPALTSRLLLASPHALELLPPITTVVSRPILADDNGKVRVLTEGYHPTGNGTVVLGGQRPFWDGDVESAGRELLSLVSEYHFETPSDLARWLAAAITPALMLGRSLGLARIPTFLAEADESQAGKGLLFEAIAGIYAETLSPISPRKGGVGSFDEDLDAALVEGRPFLFIDNLREPLISNHLESFITAPGPFSARTPHRAHITVDSRRYILFCTSNQFKTTPDLENRLIHIKIRKRWNHAWRKNRLQLLSEISRRQAALLGAVFAIGRHWIASGKPSTRERRHDFTEWAGPLDWIITNCFDGKIVGRLMDDHNCVRDTQTLADDVCSD